jgi:hypothetical protein
MIFIRFRLMNYRFDLSPLYFVLLCALMVIVYVAGEGFASFFTYSDGLAYAAAYELIEGQYPADAYLGFSLATGSAEPLSFFVFYIFSQFVNVTLANTLLNFALILTLFLLLRKRSANLWYWAPFVLTNFYILLLGFGVLRLKIAVLLILLSWLVQDIRMRAVLILASVLAHFQMLLLLAVFLADTLVEGRRRIAWKYVAVLAVAIIFAKYDAIQEKVMYYAGEGFAPPYKLIVISLISLILLDRYKVALIMFGVFLPASLLVGEGRLNIMYFFLVVHEYLLNSKRNIYKNITLVLCATYLSAKGIDFAQSLLGGYSYFEE